MALPAIGAVRAWLPGARLSVAARAAVAPLVDLVPGVDEVVTLEGRGSWRDAAGRAADAARLRAGRFDAAILLPNSFASAWLVRQAGIAERWGYRRDARGPLLTRAMAPPRGLTQAEYYAKLVEALGGPAARLTASLVPPPSARAAAERLLRDAGWNGGPLVAFAPGAAFGPAKRWPPDRVAAVARAMAERDGATPVLVGASADRSAAADVLRHCSTAIDLCGCTDLPTLAAVFSLCRAVVSNDSGAMHVAAAAGASVTAIFGPTDERATSPLPHPTGRRATVVAGEAWCRPCQRRLCPIDHRCMTSIDPERVVEAVRRAELQLRDPRP
jgi:heptosyltransferase-2